MKITVNVTQEHIDKGRAGNCILCPVAMALVNAGCDNVAVTYSRAHFNYQGPHPKRMWLSTQTIQFISDFDVNRPVSPFSFDLEF